MPPSRLSPDERAARLTMQALKVQTAGKLKVIKEALQTHPQHVANIYEKCEHLGIIATGEAKGAPGNTSQSPGGKQPNHSAKLPLTSSPEAATPTRFAKAEGDDEGDPADQPDGHDERAQQGEASGSGGSSSCHGSDDAGPAGALVPSKYWKFDAMSAVKLKEFLEFMEPVVFSKFAIRAIGSKKGSSKSTLLELLEFATGLEPQHSIVGKLRNEVVLKGELKALNEANGRRCQGLRLPPLWATQGVYRLLLDPPGPNKKLLNQYTQKSIIVPESAEKKVACLERCTIEQNWSENNAYLLDEDGTVTLKIKDLFLTCASSDQDEPQAKKVRTKDPDCQPAIRQPGGPTLYDDEVPPPESEALAAAAEAE